MLELPEVLIIAKQLNRRVVGKRIQAVLPPTKPHKFCWFCGDAREYENKMKGCRIESARGFGIYVQLRLSSGWFLSFHDGVNVRLVDKDSVSKDFQLAIILEDGSALQFTVSMYGGILLHTLPFDNQYYNASQNAPSILSDEFDRVFYNKFQDSKKNISMKEFLATRQRFPGLCNGVLQDVLLCANLHPKRKLNTLSKVEIEHLLYCVKAVLSDMTAKGGRDTEKDLYGNAGGYQTLMSKASLLSGCPHCGGDVKKETYLGGSVYYCPACQPLDKAANTT